MTLSLPSLINSGINLTSRAIRAVLNTRMIRATRSTLAPLAMLLPPPVTA